MKVYKHEIADKLETKIIANKVISYVSPTSPILPDDTWYDSKKLAKILASVNDSDLYHTKSILVSSVWNRNDDVFTVPVIFAARFTPEDKPTNIDHDESCIIGHMTGNWAVDADLNLIPDDTKPEDLPSKIHLLCSSVIYLNWQNDAMKTKILDLITSIEKGTKYVSMECLLRDFDYAVVAPDGVQSVVARNDATSFLTKHLRAYGGTGKYGEYKVGRLVKDIIFCGKGYVDNPANPESVILSGSETAFDFTKASKLNEFSEKMGVILSCTVNPTEKEMEKELEDLKAKLAALEIEKSEAAKKLVEFDNLNAEVETLKASVASKTEELAAEKAAFADLVKEHEALKTSSKAVADELNNIKAEQALQARKDKIAALELDEAEANSLLSLDDTSFDKTVELLSAMKTKYSKNGMKEKCADDSKAEEEAAKNAAAAKASFTPAPTDAEVARAHMADSVKKLLKGKSK